MRSGVAGPGTQSEGEVSTRPLVGTRLPKVAEEVLRTNVTTQDLAKSLRSLKAGFWEIKK